MKYFLLLLCVGLAIKGQSQAIQFYTGAKIEDYDAASFRLIDQDSLNLYAFRYNEPDYFLDVYEKETLKRSAVIKIPLPSKYTLKYDLEYLFIHKDTFKVCYSYFDKNELSEKLEMIAFNKSGLRVIESKVIDRSEGSNQKKAGGFSVINRKRFNEFLSFGYKVTGDTSNLNIDHFDYSGNKTASQNFVLNNSGFIVHSSIDDDCNLYHLTRSKLGNRNVNWNVKLYSPESDHAQIIALEKPSNEKVYLSNFFRSYVDKRNQLNLFSPYTLKPLSRNAEGLYLVQIDSKTHQLVNENIIPFKALKQGDDEESEFSMSACIPVAVLQLSDKITRIVFESRLETVSTVYGIQAGKAYTIGNIITVDIDGNNAVTEIHNIKKQQQTNTSNFKYTGFCVLKHDGRSYFIYNELPGNLEREPDKMKKVNSSKMDETAVIYATVDDGKIVRKILINKESDPGVDAILPNSYLSATNKDEIYVLRKIKGDIYLTKIFCE